MAPEYKMEVLDRPDIQGLIFRAYQELRLARYYLLKIEDAVAFKQWLAERIGHGDVITAADRPEQYTRALNLAFTATGLRKLDVDPEPNANGHDGFGLEFREGMIQPDRSRFLGDVEENHPRHWVWGGPQGQQSHDHIDCLCLLFARNAEAIDESWTRLGTSDAAASVCHSIDAYLTPDGKEHFGFKDGISQPIIRFTKRDYETAAPDRALHVVEAGEFILGYQNQNGRMPVSPTVSGARDSGNRLGPLVRRWRWGRRSRLDGLRDFGRNGTYLVLRQLHQDVPAFERFLTATAGEDRARQDHLAARIVGRWRSGTPLALSPDEDKQLPDEDLNRFGYFAQDSCGYRCPVGAHVRRGNPRDSTSEIDGQTHALERVNFHRLLRRGRLYGPPVQADGARSTDDRGLMFLCLNADLRRQFEFVQQTWVNSRKFGDLYDEDDPLVGRCSSFTVQRPEGHQRVDGLQRFVTVKGGAYFFMPGIRALQCLADTA